MVSGKRSKLPWKFSGSKLGMYLYLLPDREPHYQEVTSLAPLRGKRQELARDNALMRTSSTDSACCGRCSRQSQSTEDGPAECSVSVADALSISAAIIRPCIMRERKWSGQLQDHIIAEAPSHKMHANHLPMPCGSSPYDTAKTPSDKVTRLQTKTACRLASPRPASKSSLLASDLARTPRLSFHRSSNGAQLPLRCASYSVEYNDGNSSEVTVSRTRWRTIAVRANTRSSIPVDTY